MLAEKYLKPGELEKYQEAGGARAYLRALRANFETSQTDTVSWLLKLNSAVTQYTTVDLVKKAADNVNASILHGSESKKAKSS